MLIVMHPGSGEIVFCFHPPFLAGKQYFGGSEIVEGKGDSELWDQLAMAVF